MLLPPSVDHDRRPVCRCWALTALVWGLAGQAQGQQAAEPLRIDHVIVGAANLDSAIDQLRRLTGVTAQHGGVHPGRGTRNALLSLGEATYLELVAPSGEPDSTGTAAYLAGLDHPTPVGWALTSPDLAETIRRLQRGGFTVTGPIPGSRHRPDGVVLQWATAHVAGDSTGLFPFFIQWAAGEPHPARTSPAGCRLITVRLQASAPARLRRLLELTRTEAVIETGPASAMRLTLACPSGTVVLGD
jgi:hypothetical protein